MLALCMGTDQSDEPACHPCNKSLILTFWQGCGVSIGGLRGREAARVLLKLTKNARNFEKDPFRQAATASCRSAKLLRLCSPPCSNPRSKQSRAAAGGVQGRLLPGK